jgi:proteasome alpha subunit
MEEAIILGLEALNKASEGKVEAATTEIGVIRLDDRKFFKLSEKEEAEYIEKMKAQAGEKGAE